MSPNPQGCCTQEVFCCEVDPVSDRLTGTLFANHCPGFDGQAVPMAAVSAGVWRGSRRMCGGTVRLEMRSLDNESCFELDVELPCPGGGGLLAAIYTCEPFHAVFAPFGPGNNWDQCGGCCDDVDYNMWVEVTE